MTLIHMAQQVPLPDRLYQGRVQLVEVKRARRPLFDIRSKAFDFYSHNMTKLFFSIVGVNKILCSRVNVRDKQAN